VEKRTILLRACNKKIEERSGRRFKPSAVADHQPDVKAFTFGESVIEFSDGIEELQNEHFLVEAEQTAADQWKSDTRQFLSHRGVENLRDARADCRKVVGFTKLARCIGQASRIEDFAGKNRPVVRIVKTGVKYAFEVLTTGSIDDRPWTQHLVLRRRVEFALHSIAVTIPDLAAQGLRVCSKNEIGLLTADDGIDACIEISPAARVNSTRFNLLRRMTFIGLGACAIGGHGSGCLHVDLPG
jgi:hypothetical protein